MNNNCKICNSKTLNIFNTKILNKYNVDYYQCSQCDFVQTEQPYWLEEAYNNPMNYTDTGIICRNQRSSKIITSILFLFFNRNKKFLDYAGGYGVFTRIMRDIGFDFYWIDPYTKNLLSRGFEQKDSDNYHLVTTFESFEHFENPIEEIEKILKLSKNVIFSTELIPKTLPNPQDWWYYGREHGQHISIYSKKSLDIIAKKSHVIYYNLGNLHFFSKNKIGVLGTVFLKFKYAKHFLYLMFFLFSFFIKSKTFSDMNDLKN
jgi:Methyltransferase domain